MTPCTCAPPPGLLAGPPGSRVAVVPSETPGPLCALYRATCVGCRGEYAGPYRMALDPATEPAGPDPVQVIEAHQVRTGDLVSLQLHATPQNNWQRVLVTGVVAGIDRNVGTSSRATRRLVLVEADGRKRTHRIHDQERIVLVRRDANPVTQLSLL